MQSTTVKLKSRAPLWVWGLFLILIIAVVVLAVLHFTGFIDLSFLGVWYLSLFTWASETWVNAALTTALGLFLGAFIYYFFKTYVFGTKATIPNTSTPIYQSALSPPTIQPTTQQIIEETKK